MPLTLSQKGLVPWDDIKGSGTDSAALWQQNLVGDRGYVEDPRGVSPPGGQADFGDDGETCGGWYRYISPGGGGARSSSFILHTGVNLEI